MQWDALRVMTGYLGAGTRVAAYSDTLTYALAVMLGTEAAASLLVQMDVAGIRRDETCAVAAVCQL